MKKILNTIVPHFAPPTEELNSHQIAVLTEIGKMPQIINYMRSKIRLDPRIIGTEEPLNLLIDKKEYPCTMISLVTGRIIYVDEIFDNYLNIIESFESDYISQKPPA